ncbi:MAG: hypothetical protein JWO57_1632 [Pseudonocardiales bacterium]|nr:hypothetical protein [Pseudonocardiales bacterium]
MNVPEVCGNYFLEYPRVAADAIMRLPVSARIGTGAK